MSTKSLGNLKNSQKEAVGSYFLPPPPPQVLGPDLSVPSPLPLLLRIAEAEDPATHLIITRTYPRPTRQSEAIKGPGSGFFPRYFLWCF
jgi:hypothetical protein